MQISLKIKLDVQETDTPADIKELVQSKEGIPPQQQKLIWDGKQMDDDKSIKEYNIGPGAVLHLVLALRGGNC